MNGTGDTAEGTPLLRAEHLTKEFTTRGDGVLIAGKRTFVAVDDVSFEIPAKKTLAIVGESGSGKSTTARMVAKLLDRTRGHLFFEGEEVSNAKGATLRAFRSNVQVVFQDPFSSLNPRHTVEGLITAPLVYQGMKAPNGYTQLARDLMDRVGLNPDHVQRYPGQFSGGQAQRIGIARALAVRPKLVICDEAVSALDVSVQAKVITLLRDLQAELGLSYMFIAHDLAVVRQIADQVAVMHQGRIVEQGNRKQIFDEPRDEYTRNLLRAVPTINPEWERDRAQMILTERTARSEPQIVEPGRTSR